MAGDAKKLGGAALGAAVPWLAAGGAILLILYLLRKEIGDAGGLGDWLAKLLGIGAREPIASQEDTQQDSAGQDHESGGVGSAAVTGHFSIASGDTLALTPHVFNVSESVDVPLDLVNSSTEQQTVLVQIHVYLDYLMADEQKTWAQLVTVQALSGKHVEATIDMTGARVPFTRPDLYLDLTVAGVHQDRIENVEVS